MDSNLCLAEHHQVLGHAEKIKMHSKYPPQWMLSDNPPDVDFSQINKYDPACQESGYIIGAANMTNEELLEEYKRKYNQHDTYFEYSDDFTVWKKGQREAHELSNLRTLLQERGIEIPKPENGKIRQTVLKG